MLALYMTMIDTPEEQTKFERLYHLYEKKMYNIAFSILKNNHDAEDIVQESFYAIIENFEKISEISCHKTWNYIVTIVKNKSLNEYKRKNKRTITSIQEENYLTWNLPDEFNMEDYLVGEEDRKKIARLILELPEKYRFVLYLYYYQELSFSEVAHSMKITEANARQIANRARRQLEIRLRECGKQHE